MRKLAFWVLALLILVAGALPAAAQDRPSIPELLSSGDYGSFGTLLAAVDAAGLSDTLSGEGPFTVLAPTDDAFAASLEAMGVTAEDVMADADALAQILQYHVIPGRYFLRNLTSGPELETAQGETVQFDLTDGVFTVNGVNISSVDKIANNGVVHIIDGVLVPPSLAQAVGGAEAEPTEEPTAEPTEAAVEPPARPSTLDVLGAGEIGAFSTLLAAIDAAGLTDALSAEGPFTILVPTDEAFAASLEGLNLSADDLLANNDLLNDILLYHVIPGRVFFRDLTAGPELETLQGETVQFDLTDGVFTVNGVNISNVDNLTGNGIIFVIDGVLIPPSVAPALMPAPEETPEPTPEPTPETAEVAQPSLVDVLSAGELGSFNTLLTAAQAAGLVDTLSGEGPFTVFAPTDEALAAAFEAAGLTVEELLANPDTLSRILSYHVVPGRYLFRNLTSGPTLETLEGGTVQLALTDGVFTVNNATITNVDNIAGNGVIFVIDNVLLPEDIAASLAQAAPTTEAEAETASVRVAHLSPDFGNADIYINGELVAEAVPFGTIGDFVAVPEGNTQISVVPTGEPIGSVRSFSFSAGAYVTVAVTGFVANDSVEFTRLFEDFSPLPEGQARVSFFHAVPGAPSVDIRLPGGTLIALLGYPRTLQEGTNDGFDIRTVGGATYDFTVVVSGTDDEIVSQQIQVQPGQNYLVAIAGTLADPQIIVDVTEVPPAE